MTPNALKILENILKHVFEAICVVWMVFGRFDIFDV